MTVSQWTEAWTEVQLAVGGALRLACGDRRGLGFFDASIDGFWRSFRAALICYPLYLLLLAFRIAAAQWETSGVAPILAVETIAYVISWTALPLLKARGAPAIAALADATVVLSNSVARSRKVARNADRIWPRTVVFFTVRA